MKMHYRKTNRICLFLAMGFLLLPFIALAQKSYQLDSITHLKLFDNSIYLLSKQGDTYFDWRPYYKDYKVDAYFKDTRNPQTPENVVNKDCILFSVDSVQSNSKTDIIKQMLHKEFIVGKLDSNTIHTVCMISPNLFYSRYYRFEYNGQFNVDGNRKSNWHISHAQILEFDYIEMANKKIVLQGYGNNYIIPTIKGLLFGFDKRVMATDTMVITDTIPVVGRSVFAINKESSVLQTSSHFSNYDVKVVKNRNEKYELQTEKGFTLLAGEFDTIIKDKYFFITKKGKQLSIYNWLFTKIEDSISGYNFYDYYAQIIKNNELKTIGVLGKIDHYYVNTLMGCGTVPHFHYTIKKKNNLFSITSLINGPGAYNPDNSTKTIAFKNNLKFDDINFLEGTKELNYIGNTGINDDFEISRDWLIVKKGNKYGIIHFDFYEKALHEKIVLPIEYDSIVSNKMFNEPLKVYKFGLCSLFPLNYKWNKLNAQYNYKVYISNPYAALDKRYKYFMRYKKIDGKMGWLDLVKNVEIPDVN
jgi:hypothetical protein